MEKRIVQFKGMTNVPDDGINEAGDMSVLLNMRHKGGELVQCQPPSESSGGAKVEQLQYHAQSGLWLELTNDILYYRRKEGDNNKRELATGVKSFALMGNIVIMQLADKVEYAIWEGRYKVLGALPEIDTTPRITFLGFEFKHKDVNVNVQGFTQEEIISAKIGGINKALDEVYNECGYVDRAWFKIALRLFDGTYIKTSTIAQAAWYDDNNEYKPGVKNTANDIWTDNYNGSYKASVHYFNVKVEVIEDLFKNLKGWENIIASVDVFTTGSIMSFGEVLEVKNETVKRDYTTLGQKEFYDAIVNANFYKMAEYSIDGILNWEIKNSSPSNLAVQTKLTEFGQMEYLANNGYTYNSKFHIFDFKRKLFNGYTFARSEAYDSSDIKKTGKFYIYVFIRTDNGIKVVCKEIELVQYTSLEYYSYPDTRAYKMVIMDSYSKYKEISLKPHPSRNEAFGLKVDIKSGTYPGGGTYSIPYLANPAQEAIAENYTIDNIEQITNTLKVSAVDNPFYFPTAQTYKFEGDIIGLANNAEAISTGQFGAYPLFVFTKEGIWAMAVDTSGQGAYLSQSPFSREVCCGDVCPVSGGVVFTTERGLMAISGGNVVELSKPLDGLEELLFNSSGTLAGEIFTRAEYDDHTKFEPVPIRDYIKGAKLAYNYLHNEVILSNVDYGYSYVYSLDNQTWGMIDKKFDVTTNSYPELVVYDNKEQKRYTFDDADTNAVPVVAITRPFTLGSFDYKRLRQAALRTTFTGTLNFYLLGSNDGANFVCITGKEYPSKNGGESMNVTRRDLITAMSRSKQYKYFAIAIAGNMKGRVSLAELLVDAGFANNKLR